MADAATGPAKGGRGQGRVEAREGGKGRQRKNGPKNVWHRKGPTWTVGDERFKLKMPRGKMRSWNITPLVDSFDWDDSEAVMTGSIAITYPKGKKLKIEDGDEVKCYVAKKAGGRYREIWAMRIREPDFSYEIGSLSATLEDDLSILRDSRGDFSFKKGKEDHKNGWKAHEIAQKVLKQYGIKAKLAKTSYEIPKLEKLKASPLDVINEAYKQERERTGRRFVLYWNKGRLVVRPLRRNKYLAILRRQITTALVQRHRKKDFATSITLRGSSESAKDGDKGEKKKVEATVTSKRMKARYGLIHRFEDRPNADSADELRRIGRRQLKRKAEPKEGITITHPGIPYIRKGHAVMVKLDKVPGFGKKLVFVTSARHSVSSGEYEMELTLGFDDPYVDAKKERECLQKCKKAAARGEKPPKDCDCPGWIKEESKKKDTDKKKQRSGKKKVAA